MNGKGQSTDANSEMNQTLEQSDKHFKAAIMKILPQPNRDSF